MWFSGFPTKTLQAFLIVSTRYVACEIKGKDLPQQAEVAQGVPGRLRPLIVLTF